MNWIASARGRVGYTLSERSLVYVTAGVAFADMDVSIFNTFPGTPGSLRTTYNDQYFGFAVGGGYEQAVTDNLIVRGSVMYYDFGSESFVPNGTIPTRTDLSVISVMVGAAYKF